MDDLDPAGNQRMADLFEAAWEVRDNAYAPYSRYKVGAAVLSADDTIWTGCNVENVSYPVSMCAERNAIAAMVASGCKEIKGIAIATEDGGTPCGACLQVMLEFSSNPALTHVYTMSKSGEIQSYSLIELIPHGFRSADPE